MHIRTFGNWRRGVVLECCVLIPEQTTPIRTSASCRDSISRLKRPTLSLMHVLPESAEVNLTAHAALTANFRMLGQDITSVLRGTTETDAREDSRNTAIRLEYPCPSSPRSRCSFERSSTRIVAYVPFSQASALTASQRRSSAQEDRSRFALQQRKATL